PTACNPNQPQAPGQRCLTLDEYAQLNDTPFYDPNACSATGSGATGGGSVIVIDPGHSGHNIVSYDSTNGIEDHDYPNDDENEEVFYVALLVKKQLTADGYKAILTKGDTIDTNVSSVHDANVTKGANIDMGHRARADVANKNHAALAFSIHDDHGVPW